MDKVTWALLLTGIAVGATAADRSPLSYDWATYLWVLVLSLWGGIVAHARKWSDGKRPRYILAALIVDIAGSGLAGVITFLLCAHFEVEQILSAVLVGISGHMGARALFMAEGAVQRLWARVFPGDPPNA